MEMFIFKEDQIQVSEEHINLAKKKGIYTHNFCQYVDNGLMVCHICKVWYPIIYGLPVLITYTALLLGDPDAANELPSSF
jgi:uncharacterized protein YbaR (Trm112 family)